MSSASCRITRRCIKRCGSPPGHSSSRRWRCSSPRAALPAIISRLGVAMPCRLRYNPVVRFVVCACLLVACGPPKGPSQTLDKYGRALKNHDFGEAYDLMSSGFRSKVSREDYVRMMRDNPREVDETADR